MDLRSTLPRLALALAATAVAVAGVELALRLTYDDLPSLQALSVTTSLPAGVEAQSHGEQPPDCRLQEGKLLHGSWTLDAEPDLASTAEALVLWTSGDSVTMGAGVDRSQTFAADLAHRWARQSGRVVKLRNLGIQGAAYCDSIKDLHLWLDEETPDAVVLQLFADDLERRSQYTIDGQIIAFPWREPRPIIRALASRSYLGNLVWSAVGARVADGPTRGIAPADQVAFRRAVRVLVDRLDELAVPHVVTLVPPAGLPRCDDPAFAAEVEDCDWMSQDMDLIAIMLVQEGVSFVDLRTTWHGRPDVTLAQERWELEERKRLPVHPDARGHGLLADALWPALVDATAPLQAASPADPAADQR